MWKQALVGAFNQENAKLVTFSALLGPFSVIVIVFTATSQHPAHWPVWPMGEVPVIVYLWFDFVKIRIGSLSYLWSPSSVVSRGDVVISLFLTSSSSSSWLGTLFFTLCFRPIIIYLTSRRYLNHVYSLSHLSRFKNLIIYLCHSNSTLSSRGFFRSINAYSFIF